MRTAIAIDIGMTRDLAARLAATRTNKISSVA
jgi:hypothetical protein